MAKGNTASSVDSIAGAEEGNYERLSDKDQCKLGSCVVLDGARERGDQRERDTKRRIGREGKKDSDWRKKKTREGEI